MKKTEFIASNERENAVCFSLSLSLSLSLSGVEDGNRSRVFLFLNEISSLREIQLKVQKHYPIGEIASKKTNAKTRNVSLRNHLLCLLNRWE